MTDAPRIGLAAHFGLEQACKRLCTVHRHELAGIIVASDINLQPKASRTKGLDQVRRDSNVAKKRTPTLHPACKLFPLLGKQELQELADDISENGLQNPIVLLNGKVLDGQNRLAACKLAGVEPRFIEWKGSGSPLHWVVSQNMMRRHLSASQKAAVALELLPMLEKEAKERQRKSPGRGQNVARKWRPLKPTARPAKLRRSSLVPTPVTSRSSSR
jgi:hypothetical protein